MSASSFATESRHVSTAPKARGRGIARMRQEEFERGDHSVALDGSAVALHGRGSRRSGEPDPTPAIAAHGEYGTLQALASGVVLVTTHHDGRPWGATVTSCSSLSSAPPRLLIALTRSSTTFRAVEASGRFGVSTLSDAHRQLAQANSTPGAPKFLDAELLAQPPGIRSPVVAGTLSHLDCVVDQVFESAGHAIVVGEVVAAIRRRPDSCSWPLVHFESAFHHLGSPL